MSYPESAYGGPAQEDRTSSPDYGDTSNEGTFSVIDRFSSFDGTFTADRDLRIDGVVKGTIECRGTLLVAEGASVEATVNAENIAIAGELTGEILCMGRLQLLPTGRLNGNVSTASLVIAEGAIYEGDLAMEEPSASANGSSPSLNQDIPVAEAEDTTDTTMGNQEIEQPPSAEEPIPTTFIRRKGGSETPWSSELQDSDEGSVDTESSSE